MKAIPIKIGMAFLFPATFLKNFIHSKCQASR